jgi:hypothetical protein
MDRPQETFNRDYEWVEWAWMEDIGNGRGVTILRRNSEAL